MVSAVMTLFTLARLRQNKKSVWLGSNWRLCNRLSTLIHFSTLFPIMLGLNEQSTVKSQFWWRVEVDSDEVNRVLSMICTNSMCHWWDSEARCYEGRKKVHKKLANRIRIATTDEQREKERWLAARSFYRSRQNQFPLRPKTNCSLINGICGKTKSGSELK